MRVSLLVRAQSIGPHVAALGRFRKKQVTGDGRDASAGSKKQEDEKSKAEKAYFESLLKSYKYTPPKDTRTAAEKEAFKEESRKWAKVALDAEKRVTVHEQKRLDFMWESIRAIPEGPLRDAALVEDHTPAPDVMSSLVLAEIGPIPEAEIERLDPLVFDHTVLQQRSEEEDGGAVEDDAKRETALREARELDGDKKPGKKPSTPPAKAAAAKDTAKAGDTAKEAEKKGDSKKAGEKKTEKAGGEKAATADKKKK